MLHIRWASRQSTVRGGPTSGLPGDGHGIAAWPPPAPPGRMDAHVKPVQPITRRLMPGEPAAAEAIPETMTGLVEIERRSHSGRTADHPIVRHQHELPFRENVEMPEILFGHDAVGCSQRWKYHFLQGFQIPGMPGLYGLNGHTAKVGRY